MEENDTNFAGEASGGGSSSGSSGGSSGSSGGSSSSGGGGKGARGVDSSRQSPGEQRGAYEIEKDRYLPEWRREYRGARRGENREEGRSRGSEQNYQSPVHIHMAGTNEENTNTMKECTYYPVPFGGLGFGGYGAPAVAAPVAPAYGGLGEGYYTHQAALMASENACKAAENTKDAASDVKDSIQILSNQITTNQFSLLQKVCDSEKAAIENRAVILASNKETENRLQAQIAECCCDMKMLALENKQFVTEKFCTLTDDINTKFADIERRALKDEIAELRQEKTDGVNNGILNTLNAILGAVKK